MLILTLMHANVLIFLLSSYFSKMRNSQKKNMNVQLKSKALCFYCAQDDLIKSKSLPHAESDSPDEAVVIKVIQVIQNSAPLDQMSKKLTN